MLENLALERAFDAHESQPQHVGVAKERNVRIVVTGATGFIGAAAAAALRRSGAEVIAVARKDQDFSVATEASWRPLLQGVDALVNCAGIFADTGTSRVADVNARGAATLFRAAAAENVRRVVHLSAIGVAEAATPFARSKLAAERALQETDLDWVVLRPSIVFGPAAAGGSGLLRGLAALPVLPLERDVGDLQIVSLDDVVATIVATVQPSAPARVVLDLVGPERQSLAEAVQTLRRWLGWRPSRVVVVPGWLMRVAYALGDLAGWLGWRTAIRTGARIELKRGAIGDPAPWMEATGLDPKGFTESLEGGRAPIQDRLYAALYFLQPLVIGVTALFFIATGITSVGPGYAIGVELLERGGVGALSGPSVIAGGLVDIVTGLAIAWRPTARLGLWAAIALSLFYCAAGTILLPELWRDPIGPMLKIWPLIALNLAALAMVRER